MTHKFIPLVCFLSFLSACAHDIALMKLDDRLNGYASAVRWGQFETAADFQAPEAKQKLDLDYLKSVHVTAYDPSFRKESDDRKTLRQTVEIRYYHEQTGVEKTLTDRQTWIFDTAKEQWFLATPLPTFRP